MKAEIKDLDSVEIEFIIYLLKKDLKKNRRFFSKYKETKVEKLLEKLERK